MIDASGEPTGNCGFTAKKTTLPANEQYCQNLIYKFF